jgi:hypothetical protein
MGRYELIPLLLTPLVRQANIDLGTPCCDNNRIMSKREPAPITDLLKRTIVESRVPYLTLEQETGVDRSSIQRFIDGRQSIRLDKADRLAAYFGLKLTK